jgi:hypothetical protein
MEEEPTLTETVSKSNDIGPIPTARLATHTTSDLPRQVATYDRVKDEAVQRWREPSYLTYSTYTARARSFFNWPKQLQKPSPDALSKAGFFSIQVRAFLILLLYAQYIYFFFMVPHYFFCTCPQV